MQLNKDIDFSLLEMQCLSMNEKNYLLICEKELLKIASNSTTKPKMLVHVCCGPCSVFPLKFLSNFFDITVYFYNPNIFPKSELKKRYETLSDYIEILKKENIIIDLVFDSIGYDEYMKELRPFKDEKEGLNRCKLCYKKRLEQSFIYACKNNFDYLTTVMTSSRQKSSKAINKIAEELQDKYPSVKYLFSDFKKHGWAEEGYKKAKEEYNLYLQDYCGCEYSL